MDRLTRLVFLVLIAALVLPVASQFSFGKGVEPRTGTPSQWLTFVCMWIMATALLFSVLLLIHRFIHDAGHPLTERELLQLKISEGYQLMQEQGWSSLPPPYAKLEREYKERYGKNPF